MPSASSNTVVHAIVVTLVVGVLVWLVDYIPWIAAPFKTIARVVAVCALVLWLLRTFGLLSF